MDPKIIEEIEQYLQTHFFDLAGLRKAGVKFSYNEGLYTGRIGQL